MLRGAALLAIIALTAAACSGAGAPQTVDPPAEVPATEDISPSAPATGAAVASREDPRAIALRFRQKTGGLDQPVAIASPRDGTKRLFIVERPGRIRIWTRKNGLRSRPYLSIRGRVNDGGNEQGMLGLAFHPNFKNNRFFYVTYTDGQGDLRVVRFRGGSSYTSNRANRNSHRILLQVRHRNFTNHNAGQLNFDSKFLFISTGDGGGAGDPDDNAQDLSSLKGKILRINVNRQCGKKRYCVPRTNPFKGSTPGRGEIYHYGLRNPWRWSFDRKNGRMHIADVGQNSREEVSTAKAGVAGLNFGWDCREGSAAFESSPYCEGADFKDPRHDYALTGGRCAIIGGYVYRGSADPELRGMYVYSDHCSSEVWVLGRFDGRLRKSQAATAPGNISSFGEHGSGELFAVTLDGSLYRVRARLT